MILMKISKSSMRIIGFDDSPFKHKKGEKALLVGVIIRAKEYLEAVTCRDIDVDGLDVTEKIISTVNESRYSDQIQLIALDSIAFAGLNIADIDEIHKRTGIPVIAVVRKKPDKERFLRANSRLPNYERRVEIIEKAGNTKKACLDGHCLYYQSRGIDDKDATTMLKKMQKRANIPEPIRMAHIIAAGIVNGESRGRA